MLQAAKRLVFIRGQIAIWVRRKEIPRQEKELFLRFYCNVGEFILFRSVFLPAIFPGCLVCHEDQAGPVGLWSEFLLLE